MALFSKGRGDSANPRKNASLAIVLLAAGIICCIAVLLAAGSLSWAFTDKSEKATTVENSSTDVAENSTNSVGVVKENKETRAAVGGNPIKPEKPNGMWFIAGVDYLKEDQPSAKSVKREIDEFFEAMNKNKIDNLYIPVTRGGEALFGKSDLYPQMEIKDDKGEVFDVFGYIDDMSEKNGKFLIACVSASETPKNSEKINLANSQDLKKIADSIRALSQNYSIDGLIIKDYYLPEEEAAYTDYQNLNEEIDFENYRRALTSEAISELIKAAKSAKPNLYAGILVDPVWANASQLKGGSESSSDFQAYLDGFADTKSMVEEELVDFVCVDATGSLISEKLPFENIVKWWSQVTKNKNVDVITNLRADKSYGNEKGWRDNPDELVNQANCLKKIYETPLISIQSYSSFLNDPQYSVTKLLQTIEWKQDSKGSGSVRGGNNSSAADSTTTTTAVTTTEAPKIELAIATPTKSEIETNESKINFRGSGDPLGVLKCNGEPVVMSELGNFSFDYELSVGKNTIVFEHNGEKKTFVVTYNAKLIDSVSTTGIIKLPGKTNLSITVVALKGSSVNAVINGETIELTPDGSLDNESYKDIKSDYAAYIGVFTLPEGSDKDKDIGDIVINAQCNGVKDSAKGGSIIVLSDKPIEPGDPETTDPSSSDEESESSETASSSATETTEKSTTKSTTSGTTKTEPITSGTSASMTSPTETETQTTSPSSTLQPPTSQEPTTQTPTSQEPTSQEPIVTDKRAKMCSVSVEYAETYSAQIVDFKSNPLMPMLPRGTIDYIEKEVVYNNTTYYLLRSGVYIAKGSVKTYDGYEYGDNTLSVSTVSNTGYGGETLFKIRTSWNVPFNVTIAPQQYKKGYNNRVYNIDSLTAEYMDIKLFYSSNSKTDIDLDGSTLIKKAEWIDSEDGSSVLRLYFKNVGKYYGYQTYYKNGELMISLKNPNPIKDQSKPLEGKRIWLDPGHGGTDSGALGANSNFHEKQLNLLLATQIKAQLEAMGAEVYISRTKDVTMSLSDRRNKIREFNPDIAISVHHDSSPTASASGTSSFYYTPQSAKLSKDIYTQLVNTYKNNIYKNQSTMLSKVERGSNFYPFYVTRVTECPAILVEYGFVSNSTEYNVLLKDTTRDELTKATAIGILQYFADH